MSERFKVLIVGGGTAGISVAARLARILPAGEVALIEPADTHYYQPLFTLVGAGAARLAETKRPMASLIPKGVRWIQDAAVAFEPDANLVVTSQGKYAYDFLVAAPGIEVDWNRIPGLVETIGKNGVCSNFSERFVESTWRSIQNFKGGPAIFTFPDTPVKCAGAPQKIMYLAEDWFRRSGVREKAQVIFASAGAKIFGVPKYALSLERIVQERQIETRFQQNLIAVDGPRREASFRHVATGAVEVVPFELLHVTPPMQAPRVIRESPLAAATGWLEVDRHTLQHVKFTNIFGLGDASSLPTSKTGAAIRRQAPIVVQHLCDAMAGRELSLRYDGYTSCPLVTGYGRLILAEFDYDGKPVETFPFDQSRERLSMYLLKKHVLPKLYWYGMLKGRA